MFGRDRAGPALSALCRALARMLAALRPLLLAAVLLATGGALAACGGGGHVFADDSSDIGLSHVTTVDVVDVGMSWLHNVTSRRVRVLGVSLVSAPRAVHLLSVVAYPASFSLAIGRGNLLKLCGKADPPHPVTVAVAAPHADANWDVVLAFRFTKPGRYSLGRVKISYETNGQTGWQYEHLNTTITVQAARPGTKPQFDGCL